MKTKIIFILLCFLSLNVMGQGIIRRNKPKTTQPTKPVKKQQHISKVLSGNCGENVKYRYANGTLTFSGSGPMADMPEFNSFYKKMSPRKVIIESGITSIGNYAFEYCYDLSSVTIPESVTSIGDEAFYSCSNLESIHLPKALTSIGKKAFDGCALTNLTIPQSVEKIGEMAFIGNKNLLSVSVESANKNYDSRDNCNAIIETKTNRLIRGCKNTVIPPNIERIGLWAFNNCDVSAITIPNSVKVIERCAFSRCVGITSLSIPNSVVYINFDAFYGSESITEVFIPSSVRSIGDDAFNIPNLSTIQIDGGNKYYDSREKCNAIIESATNTLIRGCKNTIIPNSVKIIGKNSFHNCRGLTTIKIPESVTQIGANAFFCCEDLNFITIPNSVTIIGTHAFYRTKLTSIEIPNSVTTLEEDIFEECKKLRRVVIPKSLKDQIRKSLPEKWKGEIIYKD